MYRVCMYVCMYVCITTFMYCLYVGVAYTYIDTNGLAQGINVCMYVCMYVCVCVYVCMHVCICFSFFSFNVHIQSKLL